MNRQEVYDLIDTERNRQDAKWGAQRDHEPILWNAILTEEVGEVAEAALTLMFEEDTKRTRRMWRDELVQVAAVAVCALEALEKEEDE